MTASVMSDRAGMNSATTGNGSTIVLGAALGAVAPNVCSFQDFGTSGITNGQQVSYLILDNNGNWEVGRATFSTSGPSLTGRSCLDSSAGGLAISLSGNQQVFITCLAEDFITSVFGRTGPTITAQYNDYAASYGYGGFVNKFRNPGCEVDKRNTNANVKTVTTAGAYVTDGWIVVPTGASCTAQQAATPNTGVTVSAKSLKVIGAASVTDILVKQRIHSTIAQHLAGKTVTVQAKIYNGTGSDFTPTLTVKHAGSADVWTSPSTDVSAVSLQVCSNGSTTTVAYTFTASASAGSGLEVTFDLGNNFSTTGKNAQLTDFDIRITSGVSTGLNSNPPPPEIPPLDTEIGRNARYYNNSFPVGVSPGTNRGEEGATTRISIPAGNTVGLSVAFPAMWETPTATFWDSLGNPGKISYYASGTGDVDNSSPSASSVGPDTIFAQKNATNIEVLYFDYEVSAEL